MRRHYSTAAFLIFICLTLAGHAADPAAPTLENFFADSEIRSVQLAPDGQHLAYLSPIEGRVAIVLFDLATAKIEVLARANDENIKSFFWKDADTVLYSGDVGGNESSSIIAVSLKTRKFTRLAESYVATVNPDAATARILDPLRFKPSHILIAGRSSTGGRHFDLAWLNIRTGDRTSIAGADKDTNDWIADTAGAIRARTREVGDRQILEVRSDDHSSYFTIADWPIALGVYAKLCEPLRFNADGETLYLVKNDPVAGSTLYAYNTRTRQWGDPLFTTATGEISGVTLSWDQASLLSVSYTEERPSTHAFDPNRERLQRQIDSSLPPGTINSIRSTSQDGKLHVIAAFSDVEPGRYYLLDLRAKPRLVQLGRVNPTLEPAALLPMRPVTYTARDGLVIHGYLTLPRGAEGHRVPLIIHPHGGPFGIRDNWGFDPEVQFLASRGYAVLQPNYRGSGGYGIKFLQAGARGWGAQMQDDLTDAVQWAVAQGIADPDRVAIVGASYGGYAALAGVTFTPELYRCAVNYVGVSDLAIITSPGRRAGRMNELYASDWVGGGEIISQRSPVNFVQNIRVPTLHAYGENDPRVDIKNWDELEKELKRYGKTYELVREQNEGHGFGNAPARINFYRKVETFLAQNMAPNGRVEIKPARVIDLPVKAGQ